MTSESRADSPEELGVCTSDIYEIMMYPKIGIPLMGLCCLALILTYFKQLIGKI